MEEGAPWNLASECKVWEDCKTRPLFPVLSLRSSFPAWCGHGVDIWFTTGLSFKALLQRTMVRSYLMVFCDLCSQCRLLLINWITGIARKSNYATGNDLCGEGNPLGLQNFSWGFHYLLLLYLISFLFFERVRWLRGVFPSLSHSASPAFPKIISQIFME